MFKPYSITSLMKRWNLSLPLAKKKHRILVAHSRAVHRKDERAARKWSMANAKFDIKHLKPM